MARPQRLSKKSITVLRLIAAGYSYAHIVNSNRGMTYPDIFAAAEEAVGLLENEAPSEHDERMAEIKQIHSRAYECWTDEEDEELAGMCRDRNTVAEIAEHLGRQPSAIRSRLKKLGLEAEKRR